MAGTVTARTLRLAVLALIAFSPFARAAMPDPTAPPAQLPSATAGTSALQAILSSRERAPAAVIDGRTVTLGDWVGPAKLIRIGADHVVLQGPQGRQTLRLLEGIRPQRSSKVSRPTSP